jgi:hypothetical protein
MNHTLKLAILALVPLTVQCTTPCGTLRDVKSGMERGQPAVVALCACLAPAPAANTTCQVELSLYNVTDATLDAALATFCPAGSKATSTPVLQTRADFAKWAIENGAVRK